MNENEIYQRKIVNYLNNNIFIKKKSKIIISIFSFCIILLLSFIAFFMLKISDNDKNFLQIFNIFFPKTFINKLNVMKLSKIAPKLIFIYIIIFIFLLVPAIYIFKRKRIVTFFLLLIFILNLSLFGFFTISLLQNFTTFKNQIIPFKNLTKENFNFLIIFSSLVTFSFFLAFIFLKIILKNLKINFKFKDKKPVVTKNTNKMDISNELNLNGIAQPIVKKPERIWTEIEIERVWSKATIVPGVDPDMYRKDYADAWICKNAFVSGAESINHDIRTYAWTINLHRPFIFGGNDNIDNLEPLNIINANSKSESFPVWETCSSAKDKNNVPFVKKWKART